MQDNEFLSEVCARCGLTFGAHHAGRTPQHPRNCCPGHEGEMDWPEGAGTTFAPTGKFEAVKRGTAAKNI